MINFVHQGDTMLVHSVLRPARNRDDLRSFMRRPHREKFRVEFVKNLLSVICDDNAIASATLARGQGMSHQTVYPGLCVDPTMSDRDFTEHLSVARVCGWRTERSVLSS